MNSPKQSPIIRDAGYADLPAITDIYNDAILHTTASYDVVPQTLQQRLQWFEDHQAGGYPVLVLADAKNRVQGWASLSAFHPKPGYRHSVENSVYVAEKAQGRGYGKMLLLALLERAREKGYHAVIALIDSENSVSIHLHEVVGFKAVGRLEEAGWKFDRWLDVVYMELLLKQKELRCEGT